MIMLLFLVAKKQLCNLIPAFWWSFSLVLWAFSSRLVSMFRGKGALNDPSPPPTVGILRFQGGNSNILNKGGKTKVISCFLPLPKMFSENEK